MQATTTLLCAEISTPIGSMHAVATNSELCLLEFSDRRMLNTQLKRVKKYFQAEIIAGSNSIFASLQQQIDEYFQGHRREFSLPLKTPGSEWQQRVWQQLQALPYGQTRSYQQLAKLIGQPTAVRAVAQANGANRIAIIIPCHRIIAANGNMVGYGGKVWRKRHLLDLEAR